MELMDKLGYSDDAIELFCKKNWNVIEVRQFLTDRLANFVFSNNNIYLIEKYESLLIENYSELVLEAYANELNKAAENTADRPTYKRWADKLRHMKTIKGGIETVDMIIDRWRELYCNRRAMMQEINKVADERDFGLK